MSDNYLFTSESVTEGHPDKMCDMLSDAILDAYLEKDPYARVACEVTATTGVITVMGEITSNVVVDIPQIVRSTVKNIGYDGENFEFNGETCAVILAIDRQSQDISVGVDKSRQDNPNLNNMKDEKNMIGAGDQGMMFGYACDETICLLPAPIYYAHKLAKKLTEVRKQNNYLGPDGKTMVTFEYHDGIPFRIDTIVISVQHVEDISKDIIDKCIEKDVINQVIPENLMDENTKILVNPTGRFVKGGPCADTGLTGRKIIVDTYGGMGRHGGGAFSGKDSTKVDRTGAYAARYVAKNIVAAGIAKRCEVQIAYAIGVVDPVSVNINTFGTAKIQESDIVALIKTVFDLRPGAIINHFQMRKPIYKRLAAYGHFGREDLEVAWEKIDKVDELKKHVQNLENKLDSRDV